MSELEHEYKKNDFLSETAFHDKYFGYIVQKKPLDKKTTNGNQKYLVTVGREGEVIAKHIAVKSFSRKTGQWYMSYASKPISKQVNDVQLSSSHDVQSLSTHDLEKINSMLS